LCSPVVLARPRIGVAISPPRLSAPAPAPPRSRPGANRSSGASRDAKPPA
jgi:hypothetical protein